MRFQSIANAALTTLLLLPGLITTSAAQTVDTHALFETVGTLYAIDPDLLAAIAEVESRGRDSAVSPKGAAGLMQLMPATATRFRVSDPYDPIDNVLGAARYLSSLTERLGGGDRDLGTLPEVLAAYNAGEGAVQTYRGVPPYKETREYVRRVLWIYLTGSIPRRRGNRSRAIRPAMSTAMSKDDALFEHLTRIRDARNCATNRSCQRSH